MLQLKQTYLNDVSFRTLIFNELEKTNTLEIAFYIILIQIYIEHVIINNACSLIILYIQSMFVFLYFKKYSQTKNMDKTG